MVIDLIIWDCDGTLTTVTSSWQWIHERLGTWEKGKQHLDDFLEGNISYEEFAFRDASEWKGLPEAELVNILQKIPLRNGCKTTLTWFQDLKIKQTLVSSGLSHLIEHVATLFPVFAHKVANELEIIDGKVHGRVKIRVPWGGKGLVGEKICKEFGIKPDRALAIGDSNSDIELFRLCKYSIAIDGPEELRSAATWSATSLTEIPALLEAEVNQ
ncbi:MAG: HAD family hydrolase [Candidatus Hodarchaeales archaeon]